MGSGCAGLEGIADAEVEGEDRGGILPGGLLERIDPSVSCCTDGIMEPYTQIDTDQNEIHVKPQASSPVGRNALRKVGKLELRLIGSGSIQGAVEADV